MSESVDVEGMEIGETGPDDDVLVRYGTGRSADVSVVVGEGIVTSTCAEETSASLTGDGGLGS